MNWRHLAEAVSRRDADAESHGRAKFNQNGACLSKVASIHAGCKQWFQADTQAAEHELRLRLIFFNTLIDIRR